MKIALIAATLGLGVSLSLGGIASAQNVSTGTQFRMAQADADVTVKKKVTPFGTKKIVKKRVGGGFGIRCKKVSVTKSNEEGDSIKKTGTRCG